MSRCCEIHPPVPATHTVTLYEPGKEPRRVDVCQEHGEAMYDHKPEKLEELEANDRSKADEDLRRAVGNPQTKVRSRRIYDSPDRGPGGGPGGRSMAPDLPPPPRRSSDTYPKHGLESPDHRPPPPPSPDRARPGRDRLMHEDRRRDQIGAAVRTARQERWEKVVEHAQAHPRQPASATHNEESARPVRDENQGDLIREDWLGKDELTELGLNVAAVGIAAASAANIPGTGLPDEIRDAIERSFPRGVNDIPSIVQNMRLGIDMSIQKAKEILHAEQRKEEDARYPAQRDERGFGRDLD